MPVVCDYRASDKIHVLVKLPYRGPGISLSAVSCKFGTSRGIVDALGPVRGQNHSAKQSSRESVGYERSRVQSKSNRLTIARITISRPPRGRRCRTGTGEYASHYIPHVTAFFDMSVLCRAGPREWIVKTRTMESSALDLSISHGPRSMDFTLSREALYSSH